MSSFVFRAVVLFLLVAVASGANAQQSSVTLQEGLSGYAGTTDNAQYSSLPDDNNGAMWLWNISSAGSMGLVRFPIFAVEGGPVPNGANVVSATLSLYKYQGPDSVFKANRLLKSWHEMQSTWNVAATGSPWETPGASGATDILSTPDGQGSIGTSPGWVNITVTSSVQAFSGGTANYGWRFGYVSGPTTSKDFYTRNYTGDPTLRPKLTIVYTLGSPGLPAPQNLDASVSGTTVNLRWDDLSSDETQFKVERKTGEGGTYSQIGTVGAGVTQYPDSTVSMNTTYFYRVRASDGTNNGPYSNEFAVTVTTPSNDGGWTMDYSYDAFGNLVQTTAGSIVTTITYDLRGRKTAMADPDMGSWTYIYNALGELKSQTDAKSQTTTMAYDLLGRMTNRTEPDLVSDWTYDSCTKGIGKLCSVASDNSYSRSISYDLYGRTSQISTSFDTTTYDVGYGYDVSGRLFQITYPTGFVAKYVYNSFGHLHRLTDSSGSTVYWQADTVSASGQVLGETLGNGLTTARTYDTVDRPLTNVVSGSGGAQQNFSYTWDDVGNLLQRVDNHQSVTENFSYDKLNRLDVSSGPALVTKTFSYDMHGNITYRSDVGTYTYGAKPHAVASVSGTLNATYTYDANGNMEAGNGKTLTYTSFNMPATITGNGHTYTYTYGPSHERMRLVHSTLGTFIYLHPNGNGELLFEKETKPSGLIEHKHYLSVGSKSIAVHLTRSDATQETRYFHHDHIGSLTLITNSSGAQIERLSYEAFGKRRFPNGTDDPNNTLFGVTTDRGFTAHEHLDEVALIHMNGRVYDPVLARFMTPDPFIQAPFNLQAYNRYSYGFNNPLRGFDPSGYFFKKFFREVFNFVEDIVEDVVDVVEDVADKVEQFAESDIGRAVIGVGLAAATGGALAPTLGPVLAGAAGGFVGGYVGSGGNIEAAIIGGLTGAAFGAIGASNLTSAPRIAAHAAVGCASSAASGGSCASGALAAGFAKAATPAVLAIPNDIGRRIAIATIGGTASVLGGGDFANGAITASFAYQFNRCGGSLSCPTEAEAAREASKEIYRPTQEIRREHGGLIYQDAGAQYHHTDAIIGGVRSVDPATYARSQVPAGSSVTGAYHSHPPLPRLLGWDPERFSPGDQNYAHQNSLGISLNVYMVAPSGDVKYYSPATKAPPATIFNIND